MLTELTALLVLRTRRSAWISRPGPWLVWLSLLVGAFVLAAPFAPPLAAALGLTRLTLVTGAAVAAIVLGYTLATEIAKRLFYRRFAPR